MRRVFFSKRSKLDIDTVKSIFQDKPRPQDDTFNQPPPTLNFEPLIEMLNGFKIPLKTTLSELYTNQPLLQALFETQESKKCDLSFLFECAIEKTPIKQFSSEIDTIYQHGALYSDLFVEFTRCAKIERLRQFKDTKQDCDPLSIQEKSSQRKLQQIPAFSKQNIQKYLKKNLR